MLDARLYRTALVPLLLVVIVCAFSLRDRPAPLRTTLAPDAFSAGRALADIDGFAVAYPRRRPGSAGDAALAARVAEELRALRSYQVRTPTFRGETIDGERRLTTVIARQAGVPGPGLVVVAHRDAAGVGARAELTATAGLLELARVVAGGRLRRTVTFVSTSGGSGGAAGARDLVHRLGGPVDAVLVLGDLAGARPRRPFVTAWSNTDALAPMQLRRTVAEAVRTEVATPPGAPHAITQGTRLAFPGTVGEQGPLVDAGLPAVLLSSSGELPPGAADAIAPGRLEAFGRAALRSLVALDAGPDLDGGPENDVVTLRKVVPAWAARLLVGVVLLPPVLVTVDGFARARRRRHPVAPWLGWIAATALPLAMAAVLAWLLGLTGLLPATPPVPVPAGTIPFDGSGRIALVAVALMALLGAIALRPPALRAAGAAGRPAGPGAGAALLLVWCALAAALWVVNPYAAAFMLPAAHLWLLVVAPELRLRRVVAVALVVASVLPFAAAVLVVAGQLGLSLADVPWAALLLVAAGRGGPLGWLCWSVAAACAIGTLVLAWHARSGPPEAEQRITVRGPLTYAGPGSLGGTESALRR
jgi:hypothetical protein